VAWRTDIAARAPEAEAEDASWVDSELADLAIRDDRADATLLRELAALLPDTIADL
jgi:hypothetical protein